MAKTSFLLKINAGLFFLLACVVTLLTACTDDDVANTERSSRSVAKRVETSNMSKDDYYGTVNLAIKVVNTDPQGVSTEQNGDATAKCTVSPENDPVETAHKDKKEFTVGKINKDGKTVTCDITVSGAGQENILKCRVALESVTIFGKTYSIDVKNIHVDEERVQIVETSKKQGETGRQAVKVPVVFTLASNGTELDGQEDHQKDLTVDAIYEQFQKQGTPEVDHEEFDHATWHVNPDFSIDYMIVLKQIWTEGHEDTYVEYPYASSCIWNVIDHEDMTVKSWGYGLKSIEGLSVGTPFAVESKAEYFSEKRREDLYAAFHANGQDKDIKTVYSCEHPEVTFTKGDISYTFSFVSPSFSEISDDLLDGTSMKSGYDLKIFRNSVNAKYGNADGGVQEKVLEERCNLYKAAKAAKGIELQSKTKVYKLNSVEYTAKYYVLYTDDTKSDLMTATTSRPWELNYLGYWSMSVNGEVSQSTTAISMTKSGSNDEEQTIANGKWVCTTTSYNLANTTTVDGQKKDNKWEASVPTRMKLTLYGTEIDFGEDTPKAEAKDMAIALTNSTATQEDYKFTENLNFTVGDYTTVSEGYGFVTKAVEVTVKSWSWENAWQRVEGSVTKAHVDKVYVYTDGSTKTVSRDFTFTRGSQVFTYWETTESNNSENTGAAAWSIVSSENKKEGDWSFKVINSQLTFGVTCASTTQKDGWNIIECNNLSVEIEGDVYTFDEMTYNAQANASQAKTAETENQTTYTHTNTPNYTFGGYSMSLASANGKIFVNKTIVPEHHDGFFPDWYGLLEGDNKAACRNPHNQKDWGVGGSLKFTNGSLPYFISKDGIIEFGEFESGSTVWNSASPDSDGTLRNCNAKDASAAMKWVREATINMLSYTDGTLMGFNDGHNTVSTSKFPGTIEQHDGGKWQSISFSGARTSDGRSSFDTSF